MRPPTTRCRRRDPDCRVVGKKARRKGRTRRNDPCPCGSARKLKHCHGAWPPPRYHRTEPTIHEPTDPMTFDERAQELTRAPVHPLSFATTVVRRFRKTVPFMGWRTDDGFDALKAGAIVL